MGNYSPATNGASFGVPEDRLLSTLRTVDFPATNEDLLRIAVLDHLEVETIVALRALTHREYQGTAEVLAALQWTSNDSKPDTP